MKRKTSVYFISIIIGLILRCAFIMQYPVQPRDAYQYKSIIESWEITGVMNSSKGALSLWIMKQVSLFCQIDCMKGGIIVNNVIGIILIVLAIKIMFKMGNGLYTGLFTGLIVATQPQLLRFSTTLLRENTYLLFTVIALYLAMDFRKRKKIVTIMFTGLAIALSSLCRYEGVELLLILCVAIMMQKATKRSLVNIFILFLSFAVSILSVASILDLNLISSKELKSKIDIDSKVLKVLIHNK